LGSAFNPYYPITEYPESGLIKDTNIMQNLILSVVR